MTVAQPIIPVPKVLLIFSMLPVKTGTDVEQSFWAGVLVDLTASNERSLTFDINEGWTAEPWATLYPPKTNLVPLLITGEPGSAGTGPAVPRPRPDPR